MGVRLEQPAAVSRRRFLSALGATGVIASVGWSPHAAAGAASNPPQGWTLRSAIREPGGRLLGLIVRDLDTALVELTGSHELAIGRLVTGSFPESLVPVAVAMDSSGRVAVGGYVHEQDGTETVASPDLAAVEADGGIEALQAISAWELTGYDRRVPRWRQRPAVIGLDGTEWKLPATSPSSWASVLAATVHAGTPGLLIGAGGAAGTTYPVEASLAVQGSSGWTVHPLDVEPGHDGGLYLVDTATGPLAVVSAAAGGVVAVGGDAAVEVAGHGVAVGAFSVEADEIVVAVSAKGTVETFSVAVRAGRPSNSRRSDPLAQGWSRGDVHAVAVTGANAHVLGSPAAGYRLVTH